MIYDALERVEFPPIDVLRQGTMRRSFREMLSRTAAWSGEPLNKKKPSPGPTLEP